MEGAGLTRIGSIKIEKSKDTKFATVELVHVYDGDFTFEEEIGIREAIAQIVENKAIAEVKLSETSLNRSVLIFAAPGMERPSAGFPGVELKDFRVKRDRVGKTLEQIVLKYKFTVKLEEAFPYVIQAIGDDLLVQIEKTQGEFFRVGKLEFRAGSEGRA